MSDNIDKKKEYGHLALILFISHLPYFLISSILLIVGFWQDILSSVLKVFTISVEISFCSFTFLIVYLLFILVGNVSNRINKKNKNELSHALLGLVAMPYTIATLNPLCTVFMMIALFMINIFSGNSISTYLFFLAIHIIFIKVSCDLMLEGYLKALLEENDEKQDE